MYKFLMDIFSFLWDVFIGVELMSYVAILWDAISVAAAAAKSLQSCPTL